MGRFDLLETNRQGALRGFAPPLDYAPDGATLEANGGANATFTNAGLLHPVEAIRSLRRSFSTKVVRWSPSMSAAAFLLPFA